MTNKIQSSSNSNIVPAQTAARTTRAPGEPFKAVMAASSNAIVQGAENTLRSLPGGPIISAAIRVQPGGEGPALGGASRSAASAAGSTSAGVSGGSGEQNQIESALDNQAEQNLYYLGLQSRISAESRAYSALSNVLKTRHDTVKNAIGNIR